MGPSVHSCEGTRLTGWWVFLVNPVNVTWPNTRKAWKWSGMQRFQYPLQANTEVVEKNSDLFEGQARKFGCLHPVCWNCVIWDKPNKTKVNRKEKTKQTPHNPATNSSSTWTHYRFAVIFWVHWCKEQNYNQMMMWTDCLSTNSALWESLQVHNKYKINNFRASFLSPHYLLWI